MLVRIYAYVSDIDLDYSSYHWMFVYTFSTVLLNFIIESLDPAYSLLSWLLQSMMLYYIGKRLLTSDYPPFLPVC